MLYEHQRQAVEKLKNGSVLCGGVGTGKSRTALAYFYTKVCKGKLPKHSSGYFEPMKNPIPLFIITTARKRDTLEWEKELAPFLMASEDTSPVPIKIDSWNNIKKYTNVYGAFFIFDEQRVVGWGAWSKAFIKIARKNQWILLSATPGDTWSDYIPVFVANGFYRHKSEFLSQHAVFNRFSKYPKIDKYIGTGVLSKHRLDILVNMPYKRKTVPHYITVDCNYDKPLYKAVWKERWDPYDNCPIEETGKLCYLLRKVVNSDKTRLWEVGRILDKHKRLIVFYNYDYELQMLRGFLSKFEGVEVKEWNGQNHDELPKTPEWVYLVQYAAGAEGWNCVDTDAIVFFSQSYSYRMTIQAAGRIDRMNTPYRDLYYYLFKSKSPIDLAIGRALKSKRNFNERAFCAASA